MADETEAGLKRLLEAAKGNTSRGRPIRWLLPVDAGSTIILHSLTWHRSSPNVRCESNRPAHLALWVHPAARWCPDLVPWHPVNEHLRLMMKPRKLLAGTRHPVFGEQGNNPESYCFDIQEDLHRGATKEAGSGISMFDASDVVSTQIRNIVMLGATFAYKKISLVDLLEGVTLRQHVLEVTQTNLPDIFDTPTDEARRLLKRSSCNSIAELVLTILKVR